MPETLNSGPDWRKRAEALEMWIMATVMPAAFVSGAIEGVRY